jgi:protein-disulfide isomerase
MNKHTIPVYILLVATVGLLVWTVVKLHSFDHRINRIGLMLAEQGLINERKQVREVSIGEGNSYSMGDTAAPVTAMMFLDYECDFCKSFFVHTFPRVEEELIRTGKLRFVFRHFPIEMHPNAYAAAQMAEQARQQGKFAEMNSRLAHVDMLSRETLGTIALELGVDTTGWRSNTQTAEKVNADKQEGERIFVRGTPTFIINGKVHTGMRSFDEFRKMIE